MNWIKWSSFHLWIEFCSIFTTLYRAASYPFSSIDTSINADTDVDALCDQSVKYGTSNTENSTNLKLNKDPYLLILKILD